MNCNHNFIKEKGGSVYCKLCFYHPSGSERAEVLKKLNATGRKDYFKNYYRQKKGIQRHLTLSDLAKIKFVSYDAVLNNLHLFDVVENAKPIQVRFNEKVLNWEPRRVKKRK